ncbi:MAG: DUF5797 family protein [Halobacteriaceae archaeon]
MDEGDPADAASVDADLSEEALERLADLVDLQPTKNAELQERWGMESGSEVHSYLEETLGDYYYRDDDSLVRATADAVALVGGEPADLPPVTVSPLEARVADALPGPDARAQSVVATLHAVREDGESLSADDVRRALRSLARKGVAEVVYRTVPTFRLARPREGLDLAVREDATETPAEDDTVAAMGAGPEE